MHDQDFGTRLVRLETDVVHIRTTVDRVPSALENLARVSQQIVDGMTLTHDLLEKISTIDNRVAALEQSSAVFRSTLNAWIKVAFVVIGTCGGALLAVIGYFLDAHFKGG